MPAPAATALPLDNERGERLLAFHPASLDRVPGPVAFALVLAWRRERILLVRNRRRGVWELSGGWRDPGESAEACALRELQEESGCRAQVLSPFGWIELDTAKAQGCRPAIGAVFSAQVESGAFVAGEETDAAAFWPADALPPDTSTIDAWLVARAMGAR